jgi:hypothetical protein
MASFGWLKPPGQSQHITSGHVFNGIYMAISQTVAAPSNQVAEVLTVWFISKMAKGWVIDSTMATITMYRTVRLA